ncbi:BREX-1 system phosphatase PglZ type B [bacterium]|nr:MAG: BREX-1 system phosphatase PglZ type B [bacterium]
MSQSTQSQSNSRAINLGEMQISDPTQTLLDWMNDPSAFQNACEPEKWKAFLSIAKSNWHFSPVQDGPIGAAEKLVGYSAPWEPVWIKFECGVTQLSGVVTLLEKLKPGDSQEQKSLFESLDRLRFPAECTANEIQIRSSLLSLEGQSCADARERIDELEKVGGFWRDSLWAKIGRAPLACALEKLVELASCTLRPVRGATAQGMVRAWVAGGWKTDALVLDILSFGLTPLDFAALKVATRALYDEWLSDAANLFAKRVQIAGGSLPQPLHSTVLPGTVQVYVVGLRFDLAQRLLGKLEMQEAIVHLDWRFGPLPGVPPTALPAVTPLDWSYFNGGNNLNAQWADGHELSAESLRAQLEKEGVSFLADFSDGDPKRSQNAWTECSNFNRLGHDFGAAIAFEIDSELDSLMARIIALLNAGWPRVEVVTDHGWLLLPGNLPKCDLLKELTEINLGRCARLKPGQISEFMSVRWHWDENVDVIIAPGISCFEEETEFGCGGLSLQECVLPIMRVSRNLQL